MQFVNSAKRLVFDLTEIPFLKCLINIYRLIAKVLKDQNLFTESNLGHWFLSYVQFVQVVISQNELKLLCSVEKWITLRSGILVCFINYENLLYFVFGQKILKNPSDQFEDIHQ